MKNKILVTLIIGSFLSSSAFAEYYVSGSCGCSGCAPCGQRVVVKKVRYTRAPCYRPYKRHYVKRCYYRPVSYVPQRRNHYSITTYYYQPVPTCGCRQWVPGHCECGRYVPGGYVQKDYVTFVPAAATTYSETFYSPYYYYQDRATADDYGADMQINY